MLNIGQVRTAASPLIAVYQRMEDDLLANIASHLQVDDETGLIDIDSWRMDKLMQMGQVNRKNAKIIADKAGVSQEKLAKAIEEAGYGALKHDETIYQMAFGIGKLASMPVNLRQSSALQNILRTAVDHAANEMNLVNTTAKESARKAFTDAVNTTYLNVVTGTRDYNSAVRQAVKELGEYGIKGAHYVSASGRKTTTQLDVVIKRAVLTTSSQVAGEMQLKRAEEWGSDLVEVSSHAGARPSHAEWQGRIFSLSGKHKKYPDFTSSTGYGSIGGLKGVNCSHDFYPFFEGISEQTYKPIDIEENNKIYAESQAQRKLEREIRAEKRKIIGAEASGDKDAMLAYNKRLRDKQAEMRKFTAETGRTRRSNREQVDPYKVGTVSRAKTNQLRDMPQVDQAKKAKDQRESKEFFAEQKSVKRELKISLPDEQLARSLGAAARNYEISDRITGEVFKYVEGTQITDVEVFAGYRTANKLDPAVTMGLSREFGGKERLWQHGKEVGIIAVDDEQLRAEVHWFRNGPNGEKVKHRIKKWLD